MSSTVPPSRCRLRPVRSYRLRNDVDENCVPADWSKGSVSDSIVHVLSEVVKGQDGPKKAKLMPLNFFARLATRSAAELLVTDLPYSIEEIFLCLRVSLLDEAYEVRAAGLRAMRCFLLSPEHVRSLIRCNQIHLVVRSLDINLENKVERLQALRLIRRMIAVLPSEVPLSLVRVLVAIARDGMQERDALTRSCWATVAELCLQNPSIAARAGAFSALISSLLQPNVPHAIAESMIGAILFSLNDPHHRQYLDEGHDVQQAVAAFTDCYITPPTATGQDCETSELRAMRLLSSKRALITILRSWSGLVFFCRCPDANTTGLNGVQSLIEVLYMPYEESRRNVLELFFELLNLNRPPASEGDEFSFEVLSSYHHWFAQDSWHIYDGFVAAEGRSLLPHVSCNRLNLMDNYLAIVLHTLISYGLIEALTEVIITPKGSDFRNAVLATILLGEILHLSSRLLPNEVYSKCHSLSELVNAATCPQNSLEVRGLASTAISALERIHFLRKAPVVPFSLYLDQMIRFSNLSSLSHQSEVRGRVHLKYSSVELESDVTISSYIRDTNVLTHDPSSYNWNLIINILSCSHSLHRVDEDPCFRNFLKKLLLFFKPSARAFSQANMNGEQARDMALACCQFVEYLLEVDDPQAAEILDEFMQDLQVRLSEISRVNAAQGSILSSTKLITSMSHYYFLLIGRLTSSSRGAKILEKTGIFQHILTLVSLSCHEVYVKLILSSLDYTKDGFPRRILSKCLTSETETSKLYATNFLLVLLRAGIPDFHKWAIRLLVQQLYDECDSVVLAAGEILIESCDQKQNLEALISLKPSLAPIKHFGTLFQILFASLPTGIKYLSEAKLMDSLLNEWRYTNQFRYVRMVEDMMNEAFTMHFRSESGTYGRRSEKKTLDKDTFLPAHLYGQLSRSEVGLKLLRSVNCVPSLCAVIRMHDTSSSRKILELKAALWSVGHIASTSSGLSLVIEFGEDTILSIVFIASQSDVMSVRGTCLYVLGMIAMTEPGVHLLEHSGWHGLRHGRNDVWPLIPEAEAESSEKSTVRRCSARSNIASSTSSSPCYLLTISSQGNKHSIVGGGESPQLIRSRCGTDVEAQESDPLLIKSSESQAKPQSEKCFSPSNGIITKSRCSSYNNESSIVSSSGISMGSFGGHSPHAMAKGYTKLSPIASLDTSFSINLSSHCESHMLLHPSGQCKECESMETIPSSNDARGYATLRGSLLPVNRKRIVSTGFHAELSPTSSTSSCDSHSYDQNDLFSDNRPLISSARLSVLEFESVQSDSKIPASTEPEIDSFVGVVVPANLHLFFESPAKQTHSLKYEHLNAEPVTPSYRTHMDTLPPHAISENDGLELHNSTNCLLCYRSTGRDVSKDSVLNPRFGISKEGCEQVIDQTNPTKKPLQPLAEIISAESMTSTSSAEGSSTLNNSVVDHLLIRREVLRLVTNLSGSVAAKAAEQGMLNLKQRFPAGFQDICLYSELCLQLAEYNFRLPARKFLQEIFQDIDYTALRSQALDIVKRRESVSLKEADEESHGETSEVSAQVSSD